MRALPFFAAAAAAFAAQEVAAEPPVLTTACERALALSALPERLRSEASVFGLTDSGYRKLRAGNGPFTCVVERNHPRSLIPQCLDEAGARTILPAIIFKSERALAGASSEDIEAEFERKTAAGEFVPAPRPGVSYMTSGYNYVFIASAQAMRRVPPHVMFYAPGLTNEDIGGSFEAGQQNRGLPFIINPGLHGYMISFTERASETDEVVQACAGQIENSPPLLGQS